MEGPDKIPSAAERSKQFILIAAGCLTVLSTTGLWMAGANEETAGTITMFSAVAYAAAALIWCVLDATERGIELGFLFRLAIVFFAVIAVPYYLFKSRGFSGGMISLGFSLVFYLLLILIASVTQLLLSISDGTLDIFK